MGTERNSGYARQSLSAAIYFLAFYCSHGNPLIMPLLPFIGQEFQLEPQAMGLMITLYAIPGCFIPFFGMLEDRVGRRPMLYLCLGASMLSAALAGLAAHYGWLLVCRFWHGFFTTPLEAMTYTLIADQFSGEERALHVGRVTTLLFAGVATIPLITTAAQYLVGWRLALLIPTVLGLPILLLAWKPLARRNHAAGIALRRYTSAVCHIALSRRALSLSLIRMLVAVGLFGIVYLFLPTIVTDVAQASPHMVGISFALTSVAMSAASCSMRWHMQHLSPAAIGYYGGLVFAAGLLALLGSSNIGWIALGLMGCGWVYGLFTAVSTAYFARIATVHTRGALMAMYSMLFRAAQALGVTAMGFIFTRGGLGSVIGTGLLLTLLFSLLAATTYPKAAGKGSDE